MKMWKQKKNKLKIVFTSLYTVGWFSNFVSSHFFLDSSPKVQIVFKSSESSWSFSPSPSLTATYPSPAGAPSFPFLESALSLERFRPLIWVQGVRREPRERSPDVALGCGRRSGCGLLPRRCLTQHNGLTGRRYSQRRRPRRWLSWASLSGSTGGLEHQAPQTQTCSSCPERQGPERKSLSL